MPRKLKKGMKAFADTTKGKFFHLPSAVLSSPIYPQHAYSFRIAADMILTPISLRNGGRTTISWYSPCCISTDIAWN